MPKSYRDKLEQVNKITRKREEQSLSRAALARTAGLSPARIREIERGYEVTGGEAKDVCKALHTRWSEIWVKQDGMIVVREKKARTNFSDCHCKL